MTQNANTQALTDAGVSIWLDDLSRERITSGNLKELVDTRNVVGVTTNPSIFQAALAQGEAYTEQLAQLVASGKDLDATVFALTTTDVRDACDILMPTYEATDGKDGRVSIEVDPRIAHDAQRTTAEAAKLAAEVDRPNALIKIPATQEGLASITETIAAGISVNVTLIFSLERYRAVMNAYLEGLEQARAAGTDLSTIRSVASFFVSRVDTEVDKRLDAIAEKGGDDAAKAKDLRGEAGLANARLAYQAFEEVFSTPRWTDLEAAGAHVQRPLWASTGVKDPAYADTMYVTELVAENCVNTMPEKTLEATADHGTPTGDTITGTYAQAERVLDELASLGIEYTDVVELLEREGVAKFEKSWAELLEGVTTEMKRVETEGSTS